MKLRTKMHLGIEKSNLYGAMRKSMSKPFQVIPVLGAQRLMGPKVVCFLGAKIYKWFAFLGENF